MKINFSDDSYLELNPLISTNQVEIILAGKDSQDHNIRHLYSCKISKEQFQNSSQEILGSFDKLNSKSSEAAK